MKESLGSNNRTLKIEVNNLNILAFISARGGSKGITEKNIKIEGQAIKFIKIKNDLLISIRLIKS